MIPQLKLAVRRGSFIDVIDFQVVRVQLCKKACGPEMMLQSRSRRQLQVDDQPIAFALSAGWPVQGYREPIMPIPAQTVQPLLHGRAEIRPNPIVLE